MWNEQLVKEITSKSKEERWPYPKTFDALRNTGVLASRFVILIAFLVFNPR